MTKWMLVDLCRLRVEICVNSEAKLRQIRVEIGAEFVSNSLNSESALRQTAA